MNKLEKFLLTTGIVILIFSVITGIIGWCMNSERLFNTGCSFIFIILPVYSFFALVLWGFSLTIKKK